MRTRRGSIYLYIAALAIGWWLLMVDDTAALARALEIWQRDNNADHAEAQLAIALTRVVEKQVKPPLMKKLKPEDVDDVCSEVVMGFWGFRRSVRPQETGKLVNTLVQRKLNDQLRSYYREAEHRAPELSTIESDLLEMLPVQSGDPGADASQQAWELLHELDLSAQDHLVAYTLFLGAEKQVIAEVLGINIDTVTNSLKRCRKALAERRISKDKKEPDA